jgi:hypothetical protein
VTARLAVHWPSSPTDSSAFSQCRTASRPEFPGVSLRCSS